jgi:hypothetical protein
MNVVVIQREVMGRVPLLILLPPTKPGVKFLTAADIMLHDNSA